MRGSGIRRCDVSQWMILGRKERPPPGHRADHSRNPWSGAVGQWALWERPHFVPVRVIRYASWLVGSCFHDRLLRVIVSGHSP